MNDGDYSPLETVLQRLCDDVHQLIEECPTPDDQLMASIHVGLKYIEVS